MQMSWGRRKWPEERRPVGLRESKEGRGWVGWVALDLGDVGKEFALYSKCEQG